MNSKSEVRSANLVRSVNTDNYLQLQPEDRVNTASSLQKNHHNFCAIAMSINRAFRAVNREQRRKSVMQVSAVGFSPYTCVIAQRSCQRCRQSGLPLSKLYTDRPMFELVCRLLGKYCLPEQIALALAALYSKGHGYRVSTETIYNCIYAQSVGELKRELVACLSHAHNKRLPLSKGRDRRGQIPDMQSIHVRPHEIEDRQFLGHWEGDLIKGEGNASAVGGYAGRAH